MRQPSAIAASTAKSTALRFNTGNAPGSPRQTGQTFVFGGSPKRVEQEQNILDSVSSWTWTSSPMTGSYFARRSSETAGLVAISRDYIRGLRRRAARAERTYGFLTSGALKYFSIGISKYIISVP